MAEVVIEVRGGLVVSAKAPYGIDVKIIDYDNDPEDREYIEVSHGDIVDTAADVWSKDNVYYVAKRMGVKIDDKIASGILKELIDNHNIDYGISTADIEIRLKELKN